MKTTFRILALTCAAGLAQAQAQAQVQVDAETLLFTSPTNFKIGFQSSKGPVSITEFVPGDQDVDAWTEMVTVQVFRAVPATAAEFEDRFFKRPFPCPTAPRGRQNRAEDSARSDSNLSLDAG